MSLQVGVPVAALENHCAIARHDDRKSDDVAALERPSGDFIDNAGGRAVRCGSRRAR